MLESKYTVKTFSIRSTKVYFGADVVKVLYGDGSYDLTMISDLYVKEDIKNLKKSLKEDGLECNKNLSGVNYFPKNPFFLVDYRP